MRPQYSKIPPRVPSSETLSVPPPLPESRRQGFDRAYLFFAANYFAQGMSGIAYEPISYLLKDALGLGAGAASSFVAWMTLPYTLKPALGALSDAWPLGGYRRRYYLLGSSFLACLSWLVLAWRPSYRYGSTLALLTAVNVGVAFSDVLCDAVMVRQGQDLRKTGPYQAVQIGTLYLSLVLTGIGGGWMAAHLSYRAIFALTALFPFLIGASTFLIDESPEPLSSGRAWSGLASALKSRGFWAASAVILLWNFLPYQGTCFFYYQSDALGFSKTFIGVLSTVGGAFGVLGAWLYWRLCGRRDTLTMVRWSIVYGAPLTMVYLLYRGPLSALAITALLGVLGVAMRLSLMDMVARLCPAGAEATTFALYMALFNLAALASNTAGGKLYDVLRSGLGSPHAAMAALVLLGVGTTLACRPILPFLTLSEPAKT